MPKLWQHLGTFFLFAHTLKSSDSKLLRFGTERVFHTTIMSNPFSFYIWFWNWCGLLLASNSANQPTKRTTIRGISKNSLDRTLFNFLPMTRKALFQESTTFSNRPTVTALSDKENVWCGEGPPLCTWKLLLLAAVHYYRETNFARIAFLLTKSANF